jgi:hypothetical protein
MAAEPSGLGCCGVVPFLVVWAVLFYKTSHHHYRAVPARLERWARDEGHRIASRERRLWLRGPFFLESGWKVVYRVAVQNSDGRTRSGWVCIGGGFLWPVPEPIEVRWDPPEPEPIPEDQRPTRGNPLMWDRELDA